MSTATAPRSLAAATPAQRWWLPAAFAMFAIAWGGNEFTPLLVMYRIEYGFSAVGVNVLLFAYVLGIIPALLLGGPLSDRLGRRALMLPAPVIAILGSAVLAVGHDHAALLFLGRMLSGVSLGLAMAVGGSWIKELSSAPWDPAASSTAGARRAAMALTAGFAVGAGFAGALAQWGPMPGSTAYLLHIAVTGPAGLLLLRVPETRRPGLGHVNSLMDDLKIPSAMHRRFWLVVVPLAPWVFGAASAAYAVLPGVMSNRVGQYPIAFSALLCVVALGFGFGIQALGRKIDTPASARAVIVALVLLVGGMAAAVAATAQLAIPWTVFAAALLGLGYGMALVSGLQEIQRIATPDDLAGLTAVFYSFAYLGFAVPAIMAFSVRWLPYPVMFGFGAVAATACVLAVSRSRLPRPGGAEKPVPTRMTRWARAQHG
jgi:MFS family permease